MHRGEYNGMLNYWLHHMVVELLRCEVGGLDGSECLAL
jgi:hypothetical protein